MSKEEKLKIDRLPERAQLEKEAESYKKGISQEVNNIGKSTEQLILKLAAIGGSLYVAYKLLLLFTDSEKKKSGNFNPNIFSRMKDLAGEQLMLYVLSIARDKLEDIINPETIDETASDSTEDQPEA